MIIYSASYATLDDLDDIRDLVSDNDLECLASFPLIIALDRDSALELALASLRDDYAAVADPDECPPPDHLLPQFTDRDTITVDLCSEYYAEIVIRTHQF